MGLVGAPSVRAAELRQGRLQAARLPAHEPDGPARRCRTRERRDISYFAGLGLDITVEDSTSHGRLDMAVRFNANVYLFEFKVVEMAGEGAAMAQLKARRYADKYRGGASRFTSWRWSSAGMRATWWRSRSRRAEPPAGMQSGARGDGGDVLGADRVALGAGARGAASVPGVARDGAGASALPGDGAAGAEELVFSFPGSRWTTRMNGPRPHRSRPAMPRAAGAGGPPLLYTPAPPPSTRRANTG